MTTKIEWTNRTWNPIAGCSKVSAGCTNCYAIKQAFVRMHNPHPAIKQKFEGVAEKTKAGHLNWTGRINTDEETLQAPFKWKKPQRIFVNSMSDLFHDEVPITFVNKVFNVMDRCPQHTFQILTKRPQRMLDYLKSDFYPKHYHRPKSAVWPLPNVWLGVSVDDQETANKRIPLLLETPAAVRFLSCEPLLGPVNLNEWFSSFNQWLKINWIIAGGESGSKARPVHPDWVRSLRDQCRAAKVPFFFKQWGEWATYEQMQQPLKNDLKQGISRHVIENFEGENGAVHTFHKVGKFKAGRKLDGVEHNEYPI